MKLEVIIAIGLFALAAFSIWAVVTPNHLFVG